MRYRLRTLLILLAVVPPLLAGAWYSYDACRSGAVEIRLRADAIYITPQR